MRKIKCDLEREIEKESFKTMFGEIKARNPILLEFHSPRCLIEFMHTEKENYEKKDGIIHALIREYQNNNRSLAPLIMLILFPALEAIYFSKARKGMNDEELKGEISWAFLKTLWDYPLQNRPRKIAINLKMDTLHRVSEWGKKEWRFKNQHEQFDEDHEPVDPNADSAESEDIKSLLSVLLKQGIITEAEYYLIIATRVYGQELKDYAREHGANFDAIRKRRQRAEAKILKIIQGGRKF